MKAYTIYSEYKHGSEGHVNACYRPAGTFIVTEGFEDGHRIPSSEIVVGWGITPSYNSGYCLHRCKTEAEAINLCKELAK